MLKLKYLFDNQDLATMMLKNWIYDEESTELFKYFRISSNAIYPFRSSGKLMFLRMTPCAESVKEFLQSELETMERLKAAGFPVPSIINSISDEKIVMRDTPWGKYFAIVLEGVGKNSLENTDLTPTLCYEYGKLLSDFHLLSMKSASDLLLRSTVFDILQEMTHKLQSNRDLPKEVLEEARRISEALKKLDRSVSKYGLIHYDFELDNIMYAPETGQMYVIDFDDSMYGYYGQDVERAINSLESEVSSEDFLEFKTKFIEGYTEKGLSISDYLENEETYKSFANLYSYMRVRESLEESWDNEPEWMTHLRDRLSARNESYEKSLKREEESVVS